jgi:hypothetical protein
MLYAIALLVLCNIVAWLKGHARFVWGLELSLWTYWLTFGLATNFLGMTGWWQLCKHLGHNYWQATVVTLSISTLVSVILNTLSYGLNLRMTGAIIFVSIGGLLAR